jgi:hypothetical protein
MLIFFAKSEKNNICLICSICLKRLGNKLRVSVSPRLRVKTTYPTNDQYLIRALKSNKSL